MDKMKIEIFDSTLRDGTQGEGINFSVLDKWGIACALDALGVDFIEAGNPGANPKNTAFFAEQDKYPLNHAKLVAFGSTARKGVMPADDANCRSLLTANTPCVAIFGKSWDLHVAEVLGVSPQDNLLMVENTIRFFKEAGKEVFFDAEHFFDGCKHNPDYAMHVLQAAVDGGADCLVLCDTNGGCFPDEIFGITETVCKKFPIRIGIHCHNDSDCAAANSLAAVRAGAVHVQGTFIGFGERCGNAPLSSVIPNLQEKMGCVCLPKDNMKMLTETAVRIAEIANITPNQRAPFVGSSAFAHKGGMHIDGVSKLARSFEHIPPESVGNRRRFLMSEVAGRGAILSLIQKFAPELDKNSKEAAELTETLKKLEFEGYQYESAEASFELIVRRHLGHVKPFFELIHYTIVSAARAADTNTINGIKTPSISIINEQDNIISALVKLKVDGKEEVTAADGEGPVHAMDKALRNGLESFYPGLSKMHLIDYKVRVLESSEATAAKVRVLIQSTDGHDVWSTVGVSANIINASWIALTDSIEFYLLKNE